MPLNRDEARRWSNDRTKEEINQRRSMIREFEEEVHQFEEDIDGYEDEAEENRRRGNYYHTHEKQMDALGDAIERNYEAIDRLEKEIEFLISLL